MDVTVSVIAPTEAVALEWLARICAGAGLEQYGRPMPSLGTGRWMVRARPVVERVSGGSGSRA